MNWTRIVSERGLLKISVIETDTATGTLLLFTKLGANSRLIGDRLV